jgi:hypothetical protein
MPAFERVKKSASTLFVMAGLDRPSSEQLNLQPFFSG